MTVGHLEEYADLDLRAEPFPALLEGMLELGSSSDTTQARIAVTVNGRIAAITQTYGEPATERPFYAVIPPSAFRSGSNEVDFYLLEGDMPQVTLRALPER